MESNKTWFSKAAMVDDCMCRLFSHVRTIDGKKQHRISGQVVKDGANYILSPFTKPELNLLLDEIIKYRLAIKCAQGEEMDAFFEQNKQDGKNDDKLNKFLKSFDIDCEIGDNEYINKEETDILVENINIVFTCFFKTLHFSKQLQIYLTYLNHYNDKHEDPRRKSVTITLEYLSSMKKEMMEKCIFSNVIIQNDVDSFSSSTTSYYSFKNKGFKLHSATLFISLNEMIKHTMHIQCIRDQNGTIFRFVEKKALSIIYSIVRQCVHSKPLLFQLSSKFSWINFHLQQLRLYLEGGGIILFLTSCSQYSLSNLKPILMIDAIDAVTFERKHRIWKLNPQSHRVTVKNYFNDGPEQYVLPDFFECADNGWQSVPVRRKQTNGTDKESQDAEWGLGAVDFSCGLDVDTDESLSTENLVPMAACRNDY